MSKIHQSITMLVLALVGLVGCDYEPRVVGNANPVRVAVMRQDLRDLWLGHIFWVQHVVLFNTSIDPAEREAADKQVLANAKQIARTVTRFYGEASSRKFFALLTAHYAAVKEYSEATTAGNTRQQDAALARLASNADLFAEFLNRVNPQHLPKGTVRGLIAVHGAHHVLQINLYKRKDYGQLKETWPMMRQHVYLIADTLTTALVKQFPSQFSWRVSDMVTCVDSERRTRSDMRTRLRLLMRGTGTDSLANRRERQVSPFIKFRYVGLLRIRGSDRHSNVTCP